MLLGFRYMLLFAIALYLLSTGFRLPRERMIVICFSRLLSRKPKKPPLRALQAGIGAAAPGKADLRATGFVKSHS
jgi:hypothetical protein